MFPHTCGSWTLCSRFDGEACSDFEQACRSCSVSPGSNTEIRESLRLSTQNSAWGDHTGRGCLLHSLETGTCCHCQRGYALCMSHLISVFLPQNEGLSQKRDLNSEGPVQKRETRWMGWRGFQVPANHVPHSQGGMGPIVYVDMCKRSWECSTGAEGSPRTTHQSALKARFGCSSLIRAACRRSYGCSYWDGAQSYLCPPREALISANSCRLERSWPLLPVVGSGRGWEAESQDAMVTRILVSKLQKFTRNVDFFKDFHETQARSDDGWKFGSNAAEKRVKWPTRQTGQRHNQLLAVRRLF